MTPATGTDLATAVGYIVAGFTALAVIIGLLMRLLFGAFKKQAEQRVKTVADKLTQIGSRVDDVEKRMQKAVEDAIKDAKDAETRSLKAIEKMDQSVEKIRDKWE